MKCGEVVYPGRVDLSKNPQNIPSAEVEPKESEDKELMSYRLDSKKEEEVKTLLRTASIREIIAKTGVAHNTIMRIRNENLTEEEKATLKKSANIRGANKRELEKRESRADLQNDGKNIPSTDCGEKGGQEIMTEQTQACTNPKCPKSNPQPIGEFNKNVARPSGHESRCRTCTAQAQRDRKAATEKASAGTSRSRKALGNSRKKRQPRNPRLCPTPEAPPVNGLDAQLAIDLKAIKKRIAQEVLQICERAIEEAFA